MIPNSFDYSTAADLTEALHLVAGGAKPLAGGMSLIPMMKLRLASPDKVVDLRKVPGLNQIAEVKGEIRIGAMATHYEIESSPLLRGRCPLLPETASHIGDVQVRNMGTIGGSIAHADPAADYPAALLALEAEIMISRSSRNRMVPALNFFLDPFATALESDEIVTEIVVPIDDKATGVSYMKMANAASGFALVGVAARIRMAGGKVTLARIGVTGVGPIAFRAFEAEQALQGTSPTEASIKAAVSTLADDVDANSDLHASAEYRKAMAKVYAARSIAKAISRVA